MARRGPRGIARQGQNVSLLLFMLLLKSLFSVYSRVPNTREGVLSGLGLENQKYDILKTNWPQKIPFIRKKEYI